MACLLALGGIGAAAAAVEVSIDRNPVAANESFQLVFALDRSPDREPDFSPLERHFTVLANNLSSSHSIVNGEYTRSVRYVLRLMAEQPGDYVIPSIRFDSEASRPLQITVKAPAAAGAPDGDLTFELVVDRERSPVQAQLLVTLRLTSATGIAAYQFSDIAIDGVDTVVESLGDDQQYQKRIDDRAFLVLEKRLALFPQQAGRLTIAPPSVEVRLPSQRRYDPFNSGGKIRRLRATGAAVEIEPPPADYRAAAWLPAKRLELRERWQGDLDALIAGEPLTRSLTLVAEGLTAAQLPELELPAVDGLRQYPDQPSLDDRRATDGITGWRQRKIALIPGAAGVYRLPEIRLPWWNVDSGRVEYATLPARSLEVAPAAAPSAPPEISAPATTGRQKPVVVIRNNPFWPWFSLLLAVGWGVSALYWWWRRPTRRAARQAETPSPGAARRRLRRACAAGDALAARAALLDWGRAMPGGDGITTLRDLGRRHGADLQREIDALNRSLYAPGRGAWDAAALVAVCAQLERAQDTEATAGSPLQPLNP